MYDASTQSLPSGFTSWPRRAEAWLDDRGKAAWIAAMVLGFIFVWPVGLALLAYMIWSKRMFNRSNCAHRKSHSAPWKAQSSGNTAFDSYRNETIRRLEEEQDAFEAFLKRLRDAKDKQEFDAFMDERVKATGNEDAAKDVSSY
jgi:hypothetical protein